MSHLVATLLSYVEDIEASYFIPNIASAKSKELNKFFKLLPLSLQVPMAAAKKTGGGRVNWEGVYASQYLRNTDMLYHIECHNYIHVTLTLKSFVKLVVE